MREIKLTKNYVTLVDDEDYLMLNSSKWCVTKSGSGKVLYAFRISKIRGKAKSILMHRVIIKPPVGYQVDHINGNGLDNRKENLRICTNSENHFNLINARRDSNTGIKGIHWRKDRKKFQARIMCRGQRINLGSFFCLKKAMEKYRNAEIEYFGNFAREIK